MSAKPVLFNNTVLRDGHQSMAATRMTTPQMLPEASEPLLKSQTARLADILPNPPSLRDLAALVLAELQRVIIRMEEGSFEALLPRVNKLWGRPRRVELDLDGVKRSGVFKCVDAAGRLILSAESTEATAYEPWQVRHLTEINKL
jgi:biotin-(acetyl-CoA carboxylase) ligase